MTTIDVRDERHDDAAGVRDVNTRAFGRPDEARLVDTLRSNGAVLLSLVATNNDTIVGHVLYSPATIDGVDGAALGPMAVAPECQRHSIGSRLVETGNRRMAEMAVPFIIVLGHPAFYARFGFHPARTRRIRCEWDVPDDAFMVIVLDPHRMQNVSGVAKYRDEFSTVV